jgi:hypothetical protein
MVNGRGRLVRVEEVENEAETETETETEMDRGATRCMSWAGTLSGGQWTVDNG